MASVRLSWSDTPTQELFLRRAIGLSGWFVSTSLARLLQPCSAHIDQTPKGRAFLPTVATDARLGARFAWYPLAGFLYPLLA